MPLLAHSKKNIRKEACWLLSNVAAGTHSQIGQVITSSPSSFLLRPLCFLNSNPLVLLYRVLFCLFQFYLTYKPSLDTPTTFTFITTCMHSHTPTPTRTMVFPHAHTHAGLSSYCTPKGCCPVSSVSPLSSLSNIFTPTNWWLPLWNFGDYCHIYQPYINQLIMTAAFPYIRTNNNFCFPVFPMY